MIALAQGMPYGEALDLLWPALGQTAAMVAIVAVIAFLMGVPLAVVLHNTGPAGLFPHRATNVVVGWFVNTARSLPFLILMAAIIPFTRLVAGTTIGIWAAVVPMSIAASAYYARLTEAALREVPPEAVDVAIASAGSRTQTVLRVQLAEAVPGIVTAMTIALVGIIEMSAMAGALGAGGVGNLAISYGYNLFESNVMLVTVVTLILLVQVIQFVGDRLARLVSHG